MEKGRILYKIKELDISIIRNILNEKDKDFKFMALTPTQIQVIEYGLKHIDENIYQKDLEKVVNLRRATISGVLQTMEKNGLISRIIDIKDTRTKKIILNQKAIDIYNIHKSRLEKLESDMIKNISKDELKIFLEVLNTMNKNINI